MSFQVQPSSPEANEAYRNGICTKCLVNKPQAGSPMCYECWPLRTYSSYARTPWFYELTDADIELRERYAPQRHNVLARGRGVVDRRKDGKAQGSDLDAVGLSAEIAYGRLYRKRPNFLNPIAGTADFTMGEIGVDVKGTPWLNDGQLIAPEHAGKKAQAAELYVLGLVDQRNETVEFVGWAFKWELLDAKRLLPLGKRKVSTYQIPQTELRHMSNHDTLLGYHAAGYTA